MSGTPVSASATTATTARWVTYLPGTIVLLRARDALEQAGRRARRGDRSVHRLIVGNPHVVLRANDLAHATARFAQLENRFIVRIANGFEVTLQLGVYRVHDSPIILPPLRIRRAT